MITIRIDGQPHGKERPRFGRGHAYTAAKTRSYEEKIGWLGKVAMNGQKPLEGPLEAKLTAVFQVPKSWSRKKRQAALLHQLRPIVKPDCDNIIKVLDGLNGICFKDDAQIVELSMKKVYGPEPYLEITIQDKVLHNDLKPEN